MNGKPIFGLKMQETTVHLIGSAHIDPVWYWSRQAGMIEVLSTCRTAMEMLHNYDEFVFSLGDVWVYEILEKYCHEDLDTIKEHISNKRWHVPGGWYVQPDCNLISESSFKKHIEFGKSFFSRDFSVEVNVGFNVDSFGHSAAIPDILMEAGYDSYVMMRPMQHEMSLPGPLFIWEGNGGGEVMTWRIPRSYNAESPDVLKQNILSALEVAKVDIPHVMVFYGIGNHGGGPTRELIEWILENQDFSQGVKLKFSSPRQFFDAVKPWEMHIPRVQGELQMHAIGCYSVVGEIKRKLQDAELAILEAQTAESLLGNINNFVFENNRFDKSWKRILFNQFHDILGGTSVREACEETINELSGVIADGEEAISMVCLQNLVDLEPHPLQRLKVFRFGNYDYNSVVYHEPWLHPKGFDQCFKGTLLDEFGSSVDYQLVQQSAVKGLPRALIFETSIKSSQHPEFYLDHDHEPKAVKTDLYIQKRVVSNSILKSKVGTKGNLFNLSRKDSKDENSEWIQIHVLSDESDTWSHGKKSFDDFPEGVFEIKKVEVEEEGPLRSIVRIDTQYGCSRSCLRLIFYREKPYVDLSVDLYNLEQFKLIKLIIPVSNTQFRYDRIARGYLERSQNQLEYPFMKWSWIPNSTHSKLSTGLGIISPHCFSCSGADGFFNLTLLRSPTFAWHDPAKIYDPNRFYNTDQGFSSYRIRICFDTIIDEMDNFTDEILFKPRCFDWTKGMKS